MWYIIALITGILFGWGIMSTVIRLTSKRTKTNDTYNRISDWGTLATGQSGSIEIERAWLRKAQELFGVFCTKQHDYGPTNIGVGQLPGLVVRIGDKTSRLWQLVLESRSLARAVKGETVRDTLLDLADYGVIGLLVIDGDWPLMTPEDAWGTSNNITGRDAST